MSDQQTPEPDLVTRLRDAQFCIQQIRDDQHYGWACLLESAASRIVTLEAIQREAEAQAGGDQQTPETALPEPPFYDQFGGGNNAALAEVTRGVMAAINACSPGARLADVPTLFAFGPIYDALAKMHSAGADQERARLQACPQWQPIETAPKGYTVEGGFNQVLFRGYSKANSFSGYVAVSGWMDGYRKPVHNYAYKLVITDWMPMPTVQPAEPQ